MPKSFPVHILTVCLAVAKVLCLSHVWVESSYLKKEMYLYVVWQQLTIIESVCLVFYLSMQT